MAGLPQRRSRPSAQPPRHSTVHATLHHGQRWRRSHGAGHHAWIKLTSGDVWCCGKLLAAGDAALAHDEPCLRLQAKRPAQVFVLDFKM
ncbi:hypothetical protein [Verrucomicrobium spinosum]|uniref:pirin family protein n=1 Tax=Verrucomicrobium spinosum TaxID=2736 RepID=UPI003CCCF6E8